MHHYAIGIAIDGGAEQQMRIKPYVGLVAAHTPNSDMAPFFYVVLAPVFKIALWHKDKSDISVRGPYHEDRARQ
jgi:hypothetical protein